MGVNNSTNHLLSKIPPDWSRFRDDCFSVWFESVPALLKFTEWLNSLSNSIKFTVKYSEVCLEVLDTLLFIINGRIESKVYFKANRWPYVSIATIFSLPVLVPQHSLQCGFAAKKDL